MGCRSSKLSELSVEHTPTARRQPIQAKGPGEMIMKVERSSTKTSVVASSKFAALSSQDIKHDLDDTADTAKNVIDASTLATTLADKNCMTVGISRTKPTIVTPSASTRSTDSGYHAASVKEKCCYTSDKTIEEKSHEIPSVVSISSDGSDALSPLKSYLEPISDSKPHTPVKSISNFQESGPKPTSLLIETKTQAHLATVTLPTKQEENNIRSADSTNAIDRKIQSFVDSTVHFPESSAAKPLYAEANSTSLQTSLQEFQMELRRGIIERAFSADGFDDKSTAPVNPSRTDQESLPKPTSLSVQSKRSKSLPKQISASTASSTQLGAGKDEKRREKTVPPPKKSAIGLASSSITSFLANSFNAWKQLRPFGIIKMIRQSQINGVPIFCAILTFILHAIIIFKGEFVWDDRAAVLSNPDVLGQRSLLHLLYHDFWGQDITLEKSHKSWRPLTVLSLRMSHNLYDGANAHGFHFDNVFLHALVTYCYSTFCFQLTSSYMSERGGSTAATLASILFAVHPIHTEPVASVVGRADILCGLLFVVAIMLYRVGRKEMKRPFVAAAILSGVSCTLSKEVGVTVFGVFAASDFIGLLSTHRLENMDMPKLKGFARHTAINLVYAVLLTALHLSLHGDVKIYTWTLLENSIDALSKRKSEKMLSYAHVASVYVWKLIYPVNLSYDWGWPCVEHITSASDVRNLGTLLVVMSIVAVGWHSLKHRNTILLWSLALTIIPFVPASNLLFPVGTIVAERLLYIPSMGFSLGVGYSAALLLDSTKAKYCPARIVKRAKGGPFILLCVYILLMGMKTIHRCTEWSTEATLFESALHVCPRSLKVLNNYAHLFISTDPKHAIPYLEKAIALHEDYFSAHFNKGKAHENLGETLPAIESFTKSLALDPNDNRVRILLGGALQAHAKTLQNSANGDESVKYLLEAMKQIDESIAVIGNKDPRALHLRCEIGKALGYDTDVNIQYCNAALSANREKTTDNINEDVTLNLLGIISKEAGRNHDAVQYFGKGLEANADSHDILINLASLHTDMENYDLANTYFERAEDLDVADPLLKAYILANKGWLMQKQGHIYSARELYAQAISLSQPNPHPQIVTNLNNIDKYCETNHCE